MIETVMKKHVEGLSKNVLDGVRVVAFFDREREWLLSLMRRSEFPASLRETCLHTIDAMRESTDRVVKRIEILRALVDDDKYSPLD